MTCSRRVHTLVTKPYAGKKGSKERTVHVYLVETLVLLALVQREELLVQTRLACLVRSRALGPDSTRRKNNQF